jgi:Acyl-CoA dehydrogenases
MTAASRTLTQELIAKVHEIAPILRDNAAETDAGRRVTDASIAALDSIGVFGINSLKAYGGFEGGARMLLDVTTVIGTYCPNSAWISVISSVSSQLALRFPESAWKRAFGKGKYERMASVITNLGATAVREGDGYRVNGEWAWGSNILNSEWAIGAIAVIEEEGGEPTPGFVLLHKSDFTIKDTWYTIGMRGTGSNNFVAKDVLVPEDQIADGGSIVGPGFEMSPEASFLQRLTPISMFPTVIISGPLGGAKAALDYVIDAAGKRPITYSTYHPQNTSGAFVQAIGVAKAKIDTAEMCLQAAADLIDAAAMGTTPLSPEDRARVRNYGAHATANLGEVMNDLATIHGTATFAERSPLGRLWRDVNTGARHAIAASPLCYEIGGASLLGITPPTPLV